MPLTLTELSRLPMAQRQELSELVTALSMVRHQSKGMLGVQGALARLAVQHKGRSGWSKVSLERKYYLWIKQGEAALINHAKCGGCGLTGCSKGGQEHAPALHELLVDELWNRAGSNTTQRGVSAAWRSLMRDLSTGHSLPGIGTAGQRGTWQDVWQRLYPGKPLPRICPWGEHSVPPGWSLQSFRNQRPAAATLALETGGRLATKAVIWTPTSRTDHLKPLEYIAFDDKRIDVLVHVGNELVEPWCLFAMDISSRMLIGYTVRYRVRRQDGTKESISQRDMGHLMAGLLKSRGWPSKADGHCTTFLCENAAAACSKETEEALSMGTNGRVKVARTAMYHGNLWGHSFSETSGNPMGKSWLESAFNLMDIEAGNLPGNTGAQWRLKPMDHEAKKAYALSIIKKGEALPLEAYAQLEIPFMNPASFDVALKDLVCRLNNRNQHRIENAGFREITQWRYSDADPEWRDVSDLALFPAAVAQQLLSANQQTFKESPHAKFHREYQPEHYTKLSPELAAWLLFDTQANVEYKGGNKLEFVINKRRYKFFGREHQLKEGQRYNIKTDFDAPHEYGGHCYDHLGRYCGHLPWDAAAAYGDKDAAAQAIAQGRAELRDALKELGERRHGDGQAAQAELDRLSINLELIQAASPSATQAIESPTEVAAAQAVIRPSTTPALASPKEVVNFFAAQAANNVTEEDEIFL